jgi:hypothetical protein
MTYKPRNTNNKTQEAPKSTGRWFDEQKSKPESNPCGFQVT